MKTLSRRPPAPPAPGALAGLRRRLADAEETLRAIRAGEVDTVAGLGKRHDQVFTLQGAEQSYRVLIESMNEGALTLTADRTILYANQCFARMVQCPLEQVIGGSLQRFLSPEDRAGLRPLLRRSAKSGGKIEVLLRTAGGATLPANFSIRPLAAKAARGAHFAFVVTDMTEARRTEDLLRALAHRVVRVQEAERTSVALELHDNITQLLCGVIFRCQTLVEKLSTHDGRARREAVKLRAMLGQTAEEVERISRHLRPNILDQLGLFPALRATCREFSARTGVPATLAGIPLGVPLPPETELALFRILQEALKNVERHARARHVTVALRQSERCVQLVISDDGIGFDAEHHAARRKRKGVLGLVGMRERAAYVGGTLVIKSGPRAGTEIEVRIPSRPEAPAPLRTAA